jgi:2'-5' RNA ligase
VSDALQKIGVSFAVEGTAAEDAIRLSIAITEEFSSQIRLGGDSNSRPHVTIALGEADQHAVARVIELVDEAVRTTGPFRMGFGSVARESVTGRYVLADVAIPEHVLEWRSALRNKIASDLSGLGRMTDDPHLTVAVVEDQDSAVDQFLATRNHQPIADCRVTHVDVAHAGPRGAKGSIIKRFTLGEA